MCHEAHDAAVLLHRAARRHATASTAARLRNGLRAGIRCRLIRTPCWEAQFRGCHAVASAKCAVKIGQISEPDIERYSADLLVGMEGIRQQPVRADKALREHILSEGRALAFEQPLEPPRLDPMLRGDGHY